MFLTIPYLVKKITHAEIGFWKICYWQNIFYSLILFGWAVIIFAEPPFSLFPIKLSISFLLWYQRFWIFLLLVLCSNKLWFITSPCLSLQFMVKWFALWSQFSDGFKKGRLFIYFFLIVWMGVVISDLFTHQTKTHKYIIHHLILGIIVSAI